MFIRMAHVSISGSIFTGKKININMEKVTRYTFLHEAGANRFNSTCLQRRQTSIKPIKQISFIIINLESF